MKYVSELLKGLVIGVANILPGISGGMLAITMGVYDKILHAVTGLFKAPLKSIRILLPYGIGAGVGIVFLSLAFEYLFHTYPLQTKMAFLGLIFGGLPSLLERAFGGEDKRARGILVTAAACCAVLAVTFAAEKVIGAGGMAASVFSGRYWGGKLFLVGVLAAATMVVPGVSGSMIMMMIGYYEPVLQTNNACIRAAVNLDIAGVVRNGAVLLPYGAGMVLGVFLFAKGVEELLRRWEKEVYRVIAGLVFSSPFVVLWDVAWGEIEMYQAAGGLALALAGFVIAGLLGGEGEQEGQE